MADGEAYLVPAIPVLGRDGAFGRGYAGKDAGMAG